MFERRTEPDSCHVGCTVRTRGWPFPTVPITGLCKSPFNGAFSGPHLRMEAYMSSFSCFQAPQDFSESLSALPFSCRHSELCQGSLLSVGPRFCSVGFPPSAHGDCPSALSLCLRQAGLPVPPSNAAPLPVLQLSSFIPVLPQLQWPSSKRPFPSHSTTHPACGPQRAHSFCTGLSLPCRDISFQGLELGSLALSLVSSP